MARTASSKKWVVQCRISRTRGLHPPARRLSVRRERFSTSKSRSFPSSVEAMVADCKVEAVCGVE
eukprot:3894438-Rhodomonas_salina.2